MVQPDKVLQHHAMLPPMNVQEKIKNVINRGIDLMTPSDERAIELNAMLPSILDKAFKGEL